MNPIRIIVLAASAFLLSAIMASPARADDELTIRKFQKSVDEKTASESLMLACVKAAHPTAKAQVVERFEVTRPKPNRTVIQLWGPYKGRLTGNTYNAHVTVHIDDNPKSREVLRIDFQDLNNSVKPNEGNLAELVKRSNQYLDKLRLQTEKEFVDELTGSAITLAHPTGRAPKVEKYHIDRSRSGLLVLTVQATYTGAVTKNKYDAEVVAKIDTSANDCWRMLSIDIIDKNNTIKPGKAAMQPLLRKINGD